MFEFLSSTNAVVQNRRAAVEVRHARKYYYFTHNRKKFAILKETFSPLPLHFTILRRTIVQKIFEKHIQVIFESGLFLNWSRHRPFWAVVGIGLTLSVGVFLLERFTNLNMQFEMMTAHQTNNSNEGW